MMNIHEEAFYSYIEFCRNFNLKKNHPKTLEMYIALLDCGFNVIDFAITMYDKAYHIRKGGN